MGPVEAERKEIMSYNLTNTHFRDIYGRLLWVDPIQEENRIHEPGETFYRDAINYRIERVALAENTEHVNTSVIEEDIIITEPHL